MNVKIALSTMSVRNFASLVREVPKYTGVIGGSGDTSGVSMIMHAKTSADSLATMTRIPVIVVLSYENEKPDDNIAEIIEKMFPGMLEQLLAS